MTRAAVVTMARNEKALLPVWWHYYSRFFAHEDIYVLDHESTDGSTAGGGFVRVPVSHDGVDWGWHRDTIQAQQHRLLAEYDTVLVTDVDEIVAPHPSRGDLGEYIAAFDGEFVTCRGMEIIHMRDREPPWDPARGVLEQRGWWFANPAYSKPLLARVPMHWTGGMHGRTDGRTAPDDGLFLLHLHRLDFELCLERHRARTAEPWPAHQVEQGWGYQNRIVDPEAFESWFYEDTCFSDLPLRPEPIPPEWRGVV